MNDNVKSPWPGPAGIIPVTSGKADDANVFNRNYKKLNTVNWVGMEPNEEYAEIAAEGARTVRIIKPFADHSIILDEIQFAIKHGAIAVGVDIDHVPGTDGRYDVVDGIPLGPVMLSDLKEYVKAAGSVPFVAKGVLSVQDALKCKEAGCAAIVISHHHGRIPFGIAPLMVLPKIKAALEGSGIAIFVDCGIDTGYDAYKALALGADAVQKMNEQLSELMMYTCVKDTRSFDASVLYI